ncbi:septum formation initiator family protein [Flavobacteriaceae bacterium]|jgi:cell division protein FtsB|nr:septum formation initiator family protein [Flavobacteriaceae bacterium]
MKQGLDWNKLKSIKRSYYLYGGILLGFIFWMLFIDTHSWTLHSELNREIEKLELEKEALKVVIKSDQKIIDQLQNRDSLERFAREQYGHKKDNETVFIIEIQDSIDIP